MSKFSVLLKPFWNQDVSLVMCSALLYPALIALTTPSTYNPQSYATLLRHRKARSYATLKLSPTLQYTSVLRYSTAPSYAIWYKGTQHSVYIRRIFTVLT